MAAVFCILAGIILCFAIKLFVIGEPVDGGQLYFTASGDGQTLELQVNPIESAVALRGWRFKKDGGTLSISARKVLVSPIFSAGTFQTSIDLDGVTEVYLGGQRIWPDGEGERTDSSDSSKALEPYADVRGIDETVTLEAGEYTAEEISTYWFNQNTIFKGNEDLAAQILENGKDPGLQVSQLHAQGITGKGVTVAIIDQPLLPSHPEYAGKIEQYHAVGFTEHENESLSSMHGPAVTSLLAGDTIGTAPGVKLYYVAVKFWERNAPEMGAQALDWLIEQNKTLSESEKIRAVSVSADCTNSEYFDNHETWDKAVRRAQEADILVMDCRQEYDTCIFWPSFFAPARRDDISLITIGTPDGDFQVCPSQALGTPVGYRTTAEVYSEDEYSYSYDAVGGHSWAIPYGTGVLAMGWQVNPSLTGAEMIELLRATAYKNAAGDCFIDPAAFIDSVQKTLS